MVSDHGVGVDPETVKSGDNLYKLFRRSLRANCACRSFKGQHD